jgi:hypothetical protein
MGRPPDARASRRISRARASWQPLERRLLVRSDVPPVSPPARRSQRWHLRRAAGAETVQGDLAGEDHGVPWWIGNCDGRAARPGRRRKRQGRDHHRGEGVVRSRGGRRLRLGEGTSGQCRAHSPVGAAARTRTRTRQRAVRPDPAESASGRRAAPRRDAARAGDDRCNRIWATAQASSTCPSCRLEASFWESRRQRALGVARSGAGAVLSRVCASERRRPREAEALAGRVRLRERHDLAARCAAPRRFEDA